MRLISYFLFVCLVSFGMSCNNENQNQHHGHQHGHHANEYMNKRSFEDLVERFESPERSKWQKPTEVISLLGDINGKTVMDIGSGTGYFSFRLAEKGANVIAADVDDRFQDYIKEKKATIADTKVQLRKTEFDDPLLETEEVHHAIIVNSYHHIDDRSNYFKKVAAGLKNDGILMVVDFKKEDTPNGPPKNHRIAADQVMTELEKAGFANFELNKELLEEHYIILAHKPKI